MIFERIANINIFHKVRRLEALSKSNCFASTSRPLQIGKATNFAGIQRCLSTNVANNTNSRLLTQLPKSSLNNAQQSRMSSTGGDHVRLWVMERLVSIALPVLLPTALLLENVVTDALLATLVVMHTHWGLEAIIVDYARPIVVGHMVRKMAFIMLNLLSAATLAGLLVLIYNGPGIAKTIKNAWAIGKGEHKSA